MQKFYVGDIVNSQGVPAYKYEVLKVSWQDGNEIITLGYRGGSYPGYHSDCYNLIGRRGFGNVDDVGGIELCDSLFSQYRNANKT